MNQHYPSSPVRQQPPLHNGFESSAAAAVAVIKARSSAFTKRSLSFKPATTQASPPRSNLLDWGSPNGKLEWGMKGDELNKMRRSVSFGVHGNNVERDYMEEPDVSWVNSLVKDSVVSERSFGMKERVRLMSSAEQMYREKEQTVACKHTHRKMGQFCNLIL